MLVLLITLAPAFTVVTHPFLFRHGGEHACHARIPRAPGLHPAHANDPTTKQVTRSAACTIHIFTWIFVDDAARSMTRVAQRRESNTLTVDASGRWVDVCAGMM